MTGIAALSFGAAILILIASIPWAARRYARFEQLPQHYGLRGEPTRMGSPANAPATAISSTP